MGRKGVSKRKPKKSTPFSTSNIGGASRTSPGDHSQVQSLVKDKGAPLNRDSRNPSIGANKKHNRGN